MQICNGKILNQLQHNKIPKLIAFTLAEVIIVLGIIGIIAQLTLPGLITDISKYQRKVAFKETYTILSQAATQLYQENNGSLLGLYKTNSNDVKNSFLPYVKITRDCPYAQAMGTGRCMLATFKYLNGTTNPYNETASTSGFILKNGISVVFDSDPSYVDDCIFGGTPNVCAYVYIDVNGVEKPNIIGDDIYDLILTPQKLMLDNTGRCIYPGETNWTSGTNDGWYCSTRVMLGDN